MRQITLIVIIALSTTLAALALEQPATQPATVLAPSTAPSGVTVSGTVDFQSFLSFQKPDPSRVVIYLGSDPTLDSVPPPPKPFTVAQHNRAFVPNFIAIPKGAQVDFPNWDHFYHNVFSRSVAAPAFDLDRYPYGFSKTKTFDKVGVVQLFCNIHPFMRHHLRNPQRLLRPRQFAGKFPDQKRPARALPDRRLARPLRRNPPAD